MNLQRFKQQHVDVLAKRQPDLLATVKKIFPDADEAEVGTIAGLVMEYVIQSGGDVEIFNSDDFQLDETDEEDFTKEF